MRALRATAQRIQLLRAEADQLQVELTAPVGAVAPWLLEVPGVGPPSAAQVLVSWSHTGRFRSEAAFAALAGTNPIRFLRADDPLPARTAVAIGNSTALAHDPAGTPAHRSRHPHRQARRTAQGKSRRDAKRCLRCVIARQLVRLLECYNHPTVEVLRAP
jgi:transposase